LIDLLKEKLEEQNEDLEEAVGSKARISELANKFEECQAEF